MTDHDHKLRVFEAYRCLTFKFNYLHDDVARAEAFEKLVTQHLLAFEFIDYTGNIIVASALDTEMWNHATFASKYKFLYSFLTAHGRALWPGIEKDRMHLDFPVVKVSGPENQRSYVASFDGKFSKRRQCPKKGELFIEPEDEFELAGMSLCGKALRAYVEVLLSVGLWREKLQELPSEAELVMLAVQTPLPMTKEELASIGIPAEYA